MVSVVVSYVRQIRLVHYCLQQTETEKEETGNS